MRPVSEHEAIEGETVVYLGFQNRTLLQLFSLLVRNLKLKNCMHVCSILTIQVLNISVTSDLISHISIVGRFDCGSRSA